MAIKEKEYYTCVRFDKDKPLRPCVFESDVQIARMKLIDNHPELEFTEMFVDLSVPYQVGLTLTGKVFEEEVPNEF